MEDGPTVAPHSGPAGPGWRGLRPLVPVLALLWVQWAIHRIDDRFPFPPFSLLGFVVAHTPGGVESSGVALIGHWALRIAALIVGVAVVFVGLGALRRGFRWAMAVALLGSTAVGLLDPRSPSPAAVLLIAVAGTLAAALAYLALAPAAPSTLVPTGPRATRRRVLAGGLVVAGSAALGIGALARSLVTLTSAMVHAKEPFAVPTDSSFPAVTGLTPPVTARADHYVVDINLDAPRVDATGWRLVIDGSVDRPQRLSLDDLQAAATVEQLSMLTCISNEVGQNLTGNALWTGVSLASLLDRVGVQSGATVVRLEATDGYTETLPLERARRPEVLVAIGMDGQLLPYEHGYPARLRIPGLYGMKNVKWLTRVSLVSHEEAGYWEQRGWDASHEVRTESRIDVPSEGDTVPSKVVVAGIAWAGTRRVQRVEVSSDDGSTWRDAVLERELSPWSWRRWQVSLVLGQGSHRLVVRATDGDGVVQDGTSRPPSPSGASGYHRVSVQVKG